LPLLALASFQWFFIVESCPYALPQHYARFVLQLLFGRGEWENVTKVVFSFKTLLSFATISIVLDYLA